MGKRGNKQGSVFYRSDRKCWMAQIVVGWKPPNKEGGRMIPIKKTFSGFKTKKEALLKLNKILNGEQIVQDKVTLDEVFEKWKAFYEPRVSEKTMKDNYVYAYKQFASLKYRRMDTITAPELQKCMDDCTAGKRTHQLMKVTAGLLWAYALDAEIVKKDVTSNLYIGRHSSTTRNPLTQDDVKAIKDAIGKIRYAEYVYCQCYLGFRPSEFLEIRKAQVHTEKIDNEDVYYIQEGAKTEAGKNRIVVVPKQILDYVIERLYIPGSDYLFPMYHFQWQNGRFIEFRKMTAKYYGESVFRPLMEKLGIKGKTPYSARHTYADKLKKAGGDERDKAALMGHTDYSFTRKQYMTSPLEDLKAVTDTIE